MAKNLIISEKTARIPAAKLHGRYLGEEVYIEQPGDKADIVGKLERFSMRNPGYVDTKFEGYDVRVVVGGIKVQLKGTDDILLLDAIEMKGF
jgi:hypothetical protein